MTIASPCGYCTVSLEERGGELWLFDLKNQGDPAALLNVARQVATLAKTSPIYISVLEGNPRLARAYQRVLRARPIFTVYEIKL